MNFSFFDLHLPDDDPVYTLKKVMEELDFSGLLAGYSDKGRLPGAKSLGGTLFMLSKGKS